MNNPLISPGLGTFVWMLVAFGILVFILCKWGWPIILNSLKEREQAISDSLNAAQKAKEEIKNLQAHNEELLFEAKKERDKMLRTARMTSESIIEESKQKAQAEADRIIANAQEAIRFEKLNAVHELKNEVANLSIEIAEKLRRQELSDRAKANELVERELQKTQFN